MNNTTTTTPRVNRSRRIRRPLFSDRLDAVRGYPSFGTSALTGALTSMNR